LAGRGDLESPQADVSCPICERGEPLGVVAELPASWVSTGIDAYLGYACVIYRRHVEEPYELSLEEGSAYWGEVMLVARALARITRPRKMNYEIHGNTIPHLHTHLLPQSPAGEVDAAILGEALRQALG
jgi:diadenosine tetraphosphate (Ap4A) HIT family hydrolase